MSGISEVMMSNALEVLSPISQKIARYKFNDMRIYSVYVTNVTFPSDFYVRLAVISQNDLDALEICGKPLMKEELEINKTVVYGSVIMGKLIRGKICTISSDKIEPKCTMYAIDYGHYDHSVSFVDIYECGGEMPVEPLAVLCQLNNCFPIGGAPWEDDAADTMRTSIGKSMVRMLVRKSLENRLIVDLITKDTHIDIGRLLINNRFAVYTFPDENEKPHNPKSGYREYTFHELGLGESYNVRIQKATSMENFFVAKHDSYAEYLAERDQFTRYCDKQEGLMPNEVILGRAVGYRCPYEETIYERCCILEVLSDGTKAVIQLLDWGDKLLVEHTELKKIDFVKIRDRPAAAIYCTTTSIEEWQQHKHMIPGIEFTIVIKRPGFEFSSPHVVEIKNKF